MKRPSATSTSPGGDFAPNRVLRPREQVERQIRQAILSGTFKQGDKLPSETELAANFSVSRTTVREALRALVEAGFIRKVPGVTGGSFVQTFDHRSLATMLESSMDNVLRLGSITQDEVGAVRELLEIPSARMAAEMRTDAQLERLKAIVEEERTTDVGHPRVPALDVEFHSVLGEASGNRVLASFVGALHRVAQPVTFMELSPEIGRATVRQHMEIVRAVERADGPAAAAAMTAHLEYLSGLAGAQDQAGSPAAG